MSMNRAYCSLLNVHIWPILAQIISFKMMPSHAATKLSGFVLPGELRGGRLLVSDTILVPVFTENIIAKQALNLEYLMLVRATVALRHHVNVVVLFCASGKAIPKKRRTTSSKWSLLKSSTACVLKSFPQLSYNPSADMPQVTGNFKESSWGGESGWQMK